MSAYQFWVAGVPEQQGSMRAFVRGGHATVTHANPKPLLDWRLRIATEAQVARGVAGELIDGPVQVQAYFYLPRPKAHYGARGLKDSAPVYHDKTPDVDKLLRALLDALTGVLFHDDRQVASLAVLKTYADIGDGRQGPGVSVTVAPAHMALA